MKRLLASLTLIYAGIAFAQTDTDTGGYSGPAVLSTAGRPLGKYIGQPIEFRFHAGVYGNYYTDLTQPITDVQGDLTKVNSFGATGTVGVYGAKHGPRDTLAVDFIADYRAYAGANRQQYNGADFLGSLSYSRQMSVKTSVQTQLSAQTFGYSYGGLYRPVVDGGLNDIAPPVADGFDGRTTTVYGQAGMTHMLNQRWAATASGYAYYTKRRSGALIDSQGWNALGDLRYLLSSTASIGVSYGFTNYSYSGQFGDSWIHNVALILSKQITERWAFDAGFGAYRVETLRTQSVPLDPVLAAIVGQPTTLEPFHDTSIGPSIQATLSRTLRRGSLSLYYIRGITPGTSYFATTDRDNLGVSVSYNASNKANLGVGANYYRYRALAQGDAVSTYYGVTFGFSYRLTRMLHFTAGATYYIQQIDGGNLDRNRLNVFAGLTFSPGERPLSLF